MAGASWSSSYTLLKRQNLSPRTPSLHLGTKVPRDFVQLLNSLGPGVIDLDLETKGLDPGDPVTVLGLAGSENLLAFNTQEWTPAVWRVFFLWAKNRSFSAFNAVFDFANLERLARELEVQPLKLHGCSLVLFKMLTTEGYLGQSWGLSEAVQNVLGWEYSQKEWNAEALKATGLEAGDMWKLALDPRFSEKFHEYCALDAEAARQLRLYLEGVAGEPVLRAWQAEWNCYISLAVESQLEGLNVNRELLRENRDNLAESLADVERRIREHPELGEAVRRVEQRKTKKNEREKRVRLKKGEEPPAGVVVQVHQPPKGKPWNFYVEVVSEEVPFNFKSPLDLKDLVWTELAKGDYVVDQEAKTVAVNGRVVSLTKTGALPVNGTAFGCFGEAGALLDLRSELYTRLGFFDTYLEESEKTGKIHPKMRPHGTISGRSAAGESE